MSWNFSRNGKKCTVNVFTYTISVMFACLPSSDGLGGWSPEGCDIVINESDSSVVMCSCSHLTNFAVLVVRLVLPVPLDVCCNKYFFILFWLYYNKFRISIPPPRTSVHGLAVIQSHLN